MNMTKESKIIIIITIILSIVFLVGFGWGHATVRTYKLEKETKFTDTDNNYVFSEDEFAKTLKKYPDIDILALYDKIASDDMKILDYGSFAPMPGIEGTKSIDIETGELGICTSMTPQGVTIAENYLITSAYDHDKNHNSVLYIQDLNTHDLLKTIVLDGKPHVGGITYDYDNKNLWVCGHKNNKAEVFSITLEKLLSYDLDKGESIEYEQRIALSQVNRASYISYDNRSIYVGFFNPRGTGNVERYDLDEKGNFAGDEIVDKITNELTVLGDAVFGEETLEKIQGMTIYRDYTILSQSYGPKGSKLFIFKNDPERTLYKEEDAITEFAMPSHLEQISQHDGRLYMVFESAARAYRHRSDDVLDRVLSIDLESFIKLVVESEDE